MCTYLFGSWSIGMFWYLGLFLSWLDFLFVFWAWSEGLWEGGRGGQTGCQRQIKLLPIQAMYRKITGLVAQSECGAKIKKWKFCGRGAPQLRKLCGIGCIPFSHQFFFSLVLYFSSPFIQHSQLFFFLHRYIHSVIWQGNRTGSKGRLSFNWLPAHLNP